MSSGVCDEVRVIARITPAQLTTTSAASVGSTAASAPTKPNNAAPLSRLLALFPRRLRSAGKLGGSLADVVGGIGRATTAGQGRAVADRTVAWNARMLIFEASSATQKMTGGPTGRGALAPPGNEIWR